MASGPDHPHDLDAGGHEFPGEGEPVGGFDDADDHGADAHGHDDHDSHGGHGPADDKWVLLPIAIGVVIGIIIVAVLGLGSGVAAL